MNTRAVFTSILLVLAIGGIVFVLVGDQQAGPQAVVDQAGDPGRDGRPASGDDPAPAAEPSLADALPSDGVVVYYFHGRQRCYTCNKMETLAESVVSDRFRECLRDGKVVFQAVNIQTPEGSHFVQDFQLRSAGVVMVERQEGRDVRWRRLDEVWTKIRDDEQYRMYISENLGECLDGLGMGSC